MAKEAYRVGKKAKDARAMAAATKLIAQLEGTLNESQNLTIIYENLTLPAIQISDNPKVIDGFVEDIEFDEKTD